MLQSLLFICLIADVCSSPNINLAGKTIFQSSDHNSVTNLTSDKIINRDPSTCSNQIFWWRIDLQRVYNISCISIYNKDADNTDLSGSQIYICYNLYNVYNLSPSVLGRYVTVVTPAQKLMVLCDLMCST
uniref:Fucolectin tachylectin-4 pentraxin-1 domain-containing protein n=1 Tax=Nothobranchius furzeri TaxID=105023 RepID=A0A8C6KNS2_NOTFU